MQANPIVLVVLSEKSVKSSWVEHEVSMAVNLKRELELNILCAIALDDSWETCEWDGQLRTQIQEFRVLNFSDWRDDEALTRMFRRLGRRSRSLLRAAGLIRTPPSPTTF
jgi:hypothetical protein